MGVVNAIEFVIGSSPDPVFVRGSDLSMDDKWLFSNADIIVVRGPTGSGKSQWAYEMAGKYQNVEVIDANTFQDVNPDGDYIENFNKNVALSIDALVDYRKTLIIVSSFSRKSHFANMASVVLRDAIADLESQCVPFRNVEQFIPRTYLVEFTGYRGDSGNCPKNKIGLAHSRFEPFDFWKADGTLK